MTINHTMRIIRRQAIRLNLASDRIAVSRVALAVLDNVHVAIARRECESLLLHERDPALVLSRARAGERHQIRLARRAAGSLKLAARPLFVAVGAMGSRGLAHDRGAA
jgi:hypothetical protein